MYSLSKRILDIVVSATILGAFSPLWLAVAVAIRLSSDGPAIFQRTVVGTNGTRFTYYKFRTMIQGDDRHHRAWLQEFVAKDSPYEGGDFKVRNDPRVTRIGRLLRRTSLDEVPQLVNVLRGQMSIVGPRPPIEFEYELYDEHARRRLTVKPGITGLYQVTARSQVPFSKMLELDLEYIRRRSLRLDLWIIGRTVGVMLTGKGAG